MILKQNLGETQDWKYTHGISKIHVAIGITGLRKNLSWDDRIEEPCWGDSGMADLPRSMKILREFYFADWQFFVVCGNKFLRFEMTEISVGN